MKRQILFPPAPPQRMFTLDRLWYINIIITAYKRDCWVLPVISVLLWRRSYDSWQMLQDAIPHTHPYTHTTHTKGFGESTVQTNAFTPRQHIVVTGSPLHSKDTTKFHFHLHIPFLTYSFSYKYNHIIKNVCAPSWVFYITIFCSSFSVSMLIFKGNMYYFIPPFSW